MLVAAVGIDAEGIKHPLGVIEAEVARVMAAHGIGIDVVGTRDRTERGSP